MKLNSQILINRFNAERNALHDKHTPGETAYLISRGIELCVNIVREMVKEKEMRQNDGFEVHCTCAKPLIRAMNTTLSYLYRYQYPSARKALTKARNKAILRKKVVALRDEIQTNVSAMRP